ncbi:MAG: hypothetical protein LLG01_16055 [Planctomycetaceae bacterium]|nr:hypothetical protein [Planctomycetaceae bacterium]
MRHRALIVSKNRQELAYVTEVLFSLRDKFDLVNDQAQARRRIKKRRYDYVIVSAPMYVCSSSQVASPSVIDNFLDEMDEIYKGKLVPVIVILSHKARAWSGEIMGVSRGRRVLIRTIHNPFPRRGETLDMMIKHLVLHRDLVNRTIQHVEQSREAKTVAPTESKESGTVDDMPPLARPHMEILEAMAQHPYRAMLQVEISEASGYKRYATQRYLTELSEMGLVAQMHGRRGGYSMTQKGRNVGRASNIKQ